MKTRTPVEHARAVEGRGSGRATRVRRVLRENGLSIVLAAMFLVTAAGQFLVGRAEHNAERAEHGGGPLSAADYAASGHFLEAFFENWESEFLQMAVFVLLAVKLRQKGSAESKKLDEPEDVDEDPRRHRHDPSAPAPVRNGGLLLALYEHSLSLALFGLFLFAFAMHAVHGLRQVNHERLLHGQPAIALADYVLASRFWFESLQNWQSEFFSVLMLIVLTIFLRERGSPQSKPVFAAHAATGK